LFIPRLQALGLYVPVMPDGAFYAWADVSPSFDKLGVRNSWDWVFKVLQDTHLAVAPGRDFGLSEHMVRFSTAGSVAQLNTALERLERRLA
jgi:aspartate/methionine/tyrosine aminotransferase